MTDNTYIFVIKETELTLGLLAVIMAILFAAMLCVLQAHKSGGKRRGSRQDCQQVFDFIWMAALLS